MEKILTISVAAYNVENYIKKAMESLIFDGFEEILEVFIVDDGGKDNTLSIAKEFEKRYPFVFHAVHKENGGYGSTVNYSIAHATGKYFKLLDGDDYFDTNALKKLVDILSNIDVDVIALPIMKGIPEEGMKRYEVSGNRSADIFTIAKMGIQKDVIGNPNIVFRTKLLQESGMILPEHMLYTDAIYSIEPFALAKTIVFLPNAVYYYRMGRDEQSVSVQSKILHLEELKTIAIRLIDFYEKNKTSSNSEYMKRYIAQNACIVMKVLLSAQTDSTGKAEVERFDREIMGRSLDIYEAIPFCGKVGRLIKILRVTKYSMYRFFSIALRNIK